MKISAFAVTLWVAIPAILSGYLTWIPTYAELSEESELVVIAVPVGRRELPGPAVLPGVSRGDQAIAAVEIRTTFVVSAVLKGSTVEPGTRFDLRHYREKSPRSGLKGGGPFLIDFDTSEPGSYLMFLKRHAQGFFEALNPMEPGWCIERLQQEPPRSAA